MNKKQTFIKLLSPILWFIPCVALADAQLTVAVQKNGQPAMQDKCIYIKINDTVTGKHLLVSKLKAGKYKVCAGSSQSAEQCRSAIIMPDTSPIIVFDLK